MGSKFRRSEFSVVAGLESGEFNRNRNCGSAKISVNRQERMARRGFLNKNIVSYDLSKILYIC